jgi:hypothetical protein
MRIVAEGNSGTKRTYTYVRVFPLKIVGGAIAAITQNPTCIWQISKPDA